MKMPVRSLFCLLLVMSVRTWAWGPHWDITRAALDSLVPNDAIQRQLGSETPLLTNYCWLPDFKRLPFRTPTQDFYTDDYLLFPGVTKHFDHLCPEVEQTYAPYFRRALQALRMESPANGARWIGSLIHFVQDSGSPPHAAQIRGDVHSKMENWVDPKKILISGYEPRVLGTNDDDALQGFQMRMRGLIEFSRVRGQKLRTPVLIGNRRAVEPVALESALECARVTADVLHTLTRLADQAPARGFRLAGRVSAKPAASDGRFPAKLIVHGTNISTSADPEGRFSLRGLAPGEHRLSVVQPGSATLVTNISLRADMTNIVFALAPSGNLVRNGDFSTQWIQTNAPDFWTRINSSWEGEILALQPGQRYRARVEFQPGSGNDVMVRWSSEQPFALPKPAKGPRIETKRLSIDAPEFVFTASSNMALMQVSLRAPGHPTNSVRRLSISPMAD
jgi:hypothetical protein